MTRLPLSSGTLHRHTHASTQKLNTSSHSHVMSCHVCTPSITQTLWLNSKLDYQDSRSAQPRSAQLPGQLLAQVRSSSQVRNRRSRVQALRHVPKAKPSRKPKAKPSQYKPSQAKRQAKSWPSQATPRQATKPSQAKTKPSQTKPSQKPRQVKPRPKLPTPSQTRPSQAKPDQGGSPEQEERVLS